VRLARRARLLSWLTLAWIGIEAGWRSPRPSRLGRVAVSPGARGR